MNQPIKEIAEYLDKKNIFLNFIYTIIISTLIAVFLFVSDISPHFIHNLIMSQSFGLSICSLILVLFWLIKPETLWTIILILIMGVAGGTLSGLQIADFIHREFFPTVFFHHQGGLLQKIVLALTFGSVISYFFFVKARIRINQMEIQQERIQRLSKEKEALKAHLKLLQAQIEPHFLFNTLSNILSLIDTDPTKGKTMLWDLIQYLRTSLARTRHELITLGEEMDLIRSYLSILKIRMGERLRFTLEMREGLGDYLFPPMLIQPLVENAVKHGLEPTIEGGEIIVKAGEKNDLIRIEVIDNGRGFEHFSESGLGMANVRERLILLYGEAGRLLLEANQPRGVRAIIEVPKQEAQTGEKALSIAGKR